MSNLAESVSWDAVYQLESTDPITGGVNGIDNLPHKHLTNRTAYLKSVLETLAITVNGINITVSEDTKNMQDAILKFALDQSAQANASIRSLRQHVQQEGEFTITNRGLVSGGAITKYGSSRLLSIADGKCFMNGRTYNITAQQSLSVPEGGASSAVCYGYLSLDGSANIIFRVTAFGSDIPSNSIKVCSITVPASNTDAALAGVTVTATARVEANYPAHLDSPPSASPILKIMDANDYRLDFDVASFSGAPCDTKAIVVTGRQTNGFTATLASAADNVVVRWRASRLSLPSQLPVTDFVTNFHASSPTTY